MIESHILVDLACGRGNWFRVEERNCNDLRICLVSLTLGEVTVFTDHLQIVSINGSTLVFSLSQCYVVECC